MKQTKRIDLKMLLIVALALLLAFALVACNKDNNNNQNDDLPGEVSETELYVGTGGIWDYITKEDMEFFLGSTYEYYKKNRESSEPYVLWFGLNDIKREGIDVIGIVELPRDPDGYTGLSGKIYPTPELAAKNAGDGVVRNNIVYSPGTDDACTDEELREYFNEDIQRTDYSLDDLSGTPMKLINTVLMTLSKFRNIGAYFTFAENPEILCEYIYYDDASNCKESGYIGYFTGEDKEEYLNTLQQRFDQNIKPLIGSEYTDDSFCEVNKDDGYLYMELKTKPGFRFTYEPTGEAYVSYYYYDGEEMLDVIIPSATPEGNPVKGIGRSGGVLFDENIRSVTIPAGVTDIYPRAFSSCTNLNSVTFEDPDGWHYTTVQDHNYAGGQSIAAGDLSDKATAAQYLKNTYASYYWYRTEN